MQPQSGAEIWLVAAMFFLRRCFEKQTNIRDPISVLLFSKFASSAWNFIFDDRRVKIIIKDITGEQSLDVSDDKEETNASSTILTLIDLCDTKLIAYETGKSGRRSRTSARRAAAWRTQGRHVSREQLSRGWCGAGAWLAWVVLLGRARAALDWMRIDHAGREPSQAAR